MSRTRPQSAPLTTEGKDVIRLKPQEYMHVQDNNKNVSRVLVGPMTFTRQEHEEIIVMPQEMISVPPRHFCVVESPVLRNANGDVVEDANGQAKVRLGDREIRFAQDPFPLYPLEQVVTAVTKTRVIPADAAVKLRALRDFSFVQNGKEHTKVAGDLYLFVGPGTLVPRVEEEVVAEVKSEIVSIGEACHLLAKQDFTDRLGVSRKAGEEWLYSAVGAFLPWVEETVVKKVQPVILTESTCLHLSAHRTFVDVFGRKRNAGDQWLVTHSMTSSYLPTPNEKIVRHAKISILEKNQFCIVVNAADENGTARLGVRQVRQGPSTFFLCPGEVLENGIQPVFVLTESEAVLLVAMDPHTSSEPDGQKVERKSGDRWMVYGPCSYCPSEFVEILEKRSATPLGAHEGIYVRNVLTGKIRIVTGQTYMLRPEEELWSKEVNPIVEKRLAQQNCAQTEYTEKKTSSSAARDKTRAVSYNLPHNSVCQVYDFKSRTQRMLFGPDRVYLGPDEEFTVLSLSGSEWVPNKPTEVMPKQEGMIKALYLFLGPSSLSDVVEVETADHAKLRLQLSYSWHFEVKHGDEEGARKLFNVPDFVMDACKRIASRVRGAVAATPFDIFHRDSSNVIAKAVFGLDENGEPRKQLFFESNSFCVNSIDVQNVECVDTRTRESLQKSVKLAIEITTASQEATARQLAEEREQKAKGELERQLLVDKAEAEKERKILLQMESESRTIEAMGSSKAEAKAHAASCIIEGESAVKMAQLKADAKDITFNTEMHNLTARRKTETSYRHSMDELEISKGTQMANIEVQKFENVVNAIGANTIASMAQAGPEMQGKLLAGLGLEGYMLTDGNSPINLFNAASSLVGGAAAE